MGVVGGVKSSLAQKHCQPRPLVCRTIFFIFFAGEWIICYICGKILTFTTMQDNEGKYIFGVVKVGDKGQIVIPKEARTVYNIKPGDALLMLGDQKGMALLKTDIFQSVIDQTMEGLTK